MLNKNLKSKINPSWKILKLQNVIKIRTSRRIFESDWTSIGVPFYRVRDIVNLSNNRDINPIYISTEKYNELIRSTGKPKIGDILITGSGSLGKTFIINNNNDFYFRDCDIIWLKLNNRINTQYLNFVFKSSFIEEQIKYFNNMTTVGHYTIQTAKKTLIPFPEIEEQIKIANFLDENCSKIDTEISLLEKKSKLLEEYKQSLIFETVTKGLDKNAKMKDSGVDWIGEIPEHWQIHRISKVVKDIKTGSKDASHASEFGNYDFYTCSRKNFKCDDFCFEGPAIIMAGNGDISNIKHLQNNEKFNAYQRVYILKKFKQFERFIYYMFLAGFVNYVRCRQKGSVIEFIKIGDIRNFPISIPSRQEQIEISNFLDDQILKIDKSIDLINKKTELLKEYKQSLIHEAVTGQLEI